MAAPTGGLTQHVHFTAAVAGGRFSCPKLGVDGNKMSKSRGNGIALRAGEDETARALRRAVTDTERVITYEPQRRPEIASLLEIGAAIEGMAPHVLAEQIGDAGAAALKTRVIDAVNEQLGALRARRAELAADRDVVGVVLRSGAERANDIANRTSRTVHEALGMAYTGKRDGPMPCTR